MAKRGRYHFPSIKVRVHKLTTVTSATGQRGCFWSLFEVSKQFVFLIAQPLEAHTNTRPLH